MIDQMPPLNRYATEAMQLWTRHVPRRVAAMQDPSVVFALIGQSVQEQVDQTTRAMEQQLGQDLPFLERVGQLNAIRAQAEELAMYDLVYAPLEQAKAQEARLAPPVTASIRAMSPQAREELRHQLQEMLEDLLGDLPSPTTLQDRLLRIRDTAQDEADRDGVMSVTLTDEQAEQVQAMEQLLPLVSVDPDTMTLEQLSETIEALRPHLPD